MALDFSVQAYRSSASRPLTDALEFELRERYAGVPGSGQEPDPAEFDSPDGIFLVGSDDGVVVACGGLCRFDFETAEIRRMYVVPYARGRGIGRTLLGRLVQTAREFGYARVRLETGCLQAEALSLYRSAGFEAIPCWEPYSSDWRSICLEKRL